MFLRSFSLHLLLVWVATMGTAYAQLTMSLQLQEKVATSVSNPVGIKSLPVFVSGDAVTSQSDAETVIEGNAELRKIDTVIKAKRLSYNTVTDRAQATGDVLINRGGNRYWGPELDLSLSDFKGVFQQPQYQFLKNNANGSADKIEFVSERVSIARNASFSTCQRPETNETLAGKLWQPDWIMRADQVTFNMDEDIATAEGAQLRFKDVPILAFPNFSFPMSDKRKSGFLPLSFAQDSQSGWEYTQPYYWNISPNKDLTLYPSYIAKRGLNQGAEFRYLEPHFSGQLRADFLANDKLYGDSRWGFSLDHRALTSSSWSDSGSVTSRLQLNRVSDDSYWRDFPRASGSLTQRLLNNEFSTNASLDGWITQLRVQRWQTLQNQSSVITPPFDRAPQITTRKSFYSPSGLQMQIEGDFTAFSSRTDLTAQPNGQRLWSAMQVAYPWTGASSYITPKAQIHASAYQLANTTASTDNYKQRIVPTLSLDSGLFFERDSALFGTAYQQTLEPRAFYVYTPYRDQSAFPNYDSGIKDFTPYTIYTENPYVGNDRIADMNMLTLGLTTRFIHPATGAEAVRAGIAQRYRFADQLVTLPGQTAQTDKRSDWLLSTGVNVSPTWAVDGSVQIGVKSNVSERTTIAARYNPSNYRSLYAAYRMQKDVSEQVDLGWQWPLSDAQRWYSVGRLNYSTKDQRLVNAIVGFEYDADCWVGRVAIEQIQLDLNTTNQRVMFQLELVGFSRVGISPLASLRRNIPRYQNLREQITTPSRFSQYD